MQRVFAMYKLKQGVTIDEYRRWSVSGDQKIIPFQPGVYSFEVFEIEEAEDGESPYTIIEVIDVKSWETWKKILSSEAMKETTESWGNYGDESTLKVVYGNKLE